ncbi:RyR domain-containing protein [Lachnospiraceae bacterium 38-10]
MKKYTPMPIDTSDISLSEDLLKLTEKLAENVHENWAKRRLEEGWTPGPVRDDEKRTTPCLIPYSQLPEIEKSYDRNTAMETLKLIFKLGYTIEPKKGGRENASE